MYNIGIMSTKFKANENQFTGTEVSYIRFTRVISRLSGIVYVAVEVRNATLCRNNNFAYWACKVCVSIRLCTSSVFIRDLLPYVHTCTLIQGLHVHFGACLKLIALSWAKKLQFEDVGVDQTESFRLTVILSPTEAL